MKILIEQTKYEPIKKTVEVTVPEKPLYLWHNGIRRAYSIKPVWTQWNVEHYNKPEEIYELHIVMVDPSLSKIEYVEILVSTLANIINDSKHPYQRVIDNILNYPDENNRTYSDFVTDMDNVIQKIKGAIL